MSNEAQQGAGDVPAGAIRVWHDPSIAGKRVEADGGEEVPGSGAGSRATFTGVLTGRRMVQGDPPWSWMEIGDLTEAPEDFEDAYVWCEESYIYFMDE